MIIEINLRVENEEFNMGQEEKDFPILIFMITYMGILCMYLVTYKQGSSLLWGFFIIERLLSFSYEQEIDDYLSAIEVSKISGMRMMVIIGFILFAIGIFLYIPFKYPGLFVILMLGEVLDFIIKAVKKKLKRK